MDGAAFGDATWKPWIRRRRRGAGHGLADGGRRRLCAVARRLGCADTRAGSAKSKNALGEGSSV